MLYFFSFEDESNKLNVEAQKLANGRLNTGSFNERRPVSLMGDLKSPLEIVVKVAGNCLFSVIAWIFTAKYTLNPEQ